MDEVEVRRIQEWLHAVKWCPGCKQWLAISRFRLRPNSRTQRRECDGCVRKATLRKYASRAA